MKHMLFALMLAAASIAHGQDWLTDYNAALQQAKKQNKPVLMDFTGSDWCGGCILLQRRVFSTSDFKAYAAENLVLLKVDFPRRNPLPPAQATRNEALARHYGVDGFPTIIILHPDGTRAGVVDIRFNGPKGLISAVEKILAK